MHLALLCSDVNNVCLRLLSSSASGFEGVTSLIRECKFKKPTSRVLFCIHGFPCHCERSEAISLPFLEIATSLVAPGKDR